jgi:hypothetical protein
VSLTTGIEGNNGDDGSGGDGCGGGHSRSNIAAVVVTVVATILVAVK